MELSFHNSEFEREVRERLNIFDCAITGADAQNVTELDLTNFDFEDEDIDTLLQFKNLKVLAIETITKDFLFWKHFPKIEELYWLVWGGPVDFSVFSIMTKLSRLTVSGGDYSSIAFENLEALVPLKKLKHLELHEFGPVDLAPLEAMKQLKSLAVRYSHEVKSMATIGTMVQLQELTLDGLAVDNLDFLDTLADDIELKMCGIQIPSREAVNIEKWKRFTNSDICEIAINGPWEYLDLSALND